MGGILSRWSTSKAQLPPIEEVRDEDPVLTRTLDFAWVTLATNDSYSLGALVLAHSLRNANTVHKLAVLITPAVSTLMREQLSTVFDVVKVVDVLDSQDESHLALMRRPELGVTFTKLHCWTLTQFEKCVFLDADTLVMRNCDELFEREELSAAPDVGWPDCFNTGVFVYKPSLETFSNLIKFSMEHGSFDGGDQGLLNQYFDNWATEDIKKHLPFVYNLTSVAVYSYIPAFKHYGSDVRIAHFIGPGKPWLQQLNPSTKKVNPAPGSEHLAPLLQKWWDIFCEKVHPSMSTNLECASGMSNDDIEACDNNVPLDTEPAEYIQPFTYCTDENDSRQINLPYHSFDVKSSTGELLNITYLEQRERDILEELNREREEEQKRIEEEENHFPVEDQEIKEEEKEEEEQQQPEQVNKLDDDECNEFEGKEREEIIMESKEDLETEAESTVSQPVSDESQKEEEKESAPQGEQSSFNCNTFFPDEICVQNYLEKNFHTYQTQGGENKDVNIEATQDDPPLPRFLTIAEDDKRQSLNVCVEEQSPPSPHATPIQNTLPVDCPSYETGVGEEVGRTDSHENVRDPEVISEELCAPEVQTAKTLPSSEENLLPSKPVEEISSWKPHATVNVDSNKKFSMPKLKPLLPKQNVSHETVNEARPKVTQYTEFHMNCDYEDYVPCDKLGFVERHILEEVKINQMDKDTKLKTLSYIFPQRKNNNKENKVELVAPDSFDEMTDYDLSLCQRQKGNQPITVANGKNYSRRNSCFLPVLKPLKPSRGNEMCRRSSSNGLRSKDRGTKAKVESRKAREKAKTEIKSNVQTHSVEDVLKRLLSFSKGYQKYFTEFATEKQKSDTAAAPNIVKNGYKESSESPRLQYSKEFEDNMDTPFEKVFRSGVSPLLNGESHTKLNGEYSAANDLIVTTISPVNGIAEDKKTKEDVVEEVIVPKIESLKLLEKPVRPTEENGHRIESRDSERGNFFTRKMETGGRGNIVGGEDDDNELATTFKESPIARSVIVKEGEGTLEAVPTRSINTARRRKKRQRWSAVQGKEEVHKSVDLTVRTSFAPPYSSAKGPAAKPPSVFKPLPDDASINAGKSTSVSRRPSKTFSQSVRKKSQGTVTVKVAPSVDDPGANNSGLAGAIAKLSLQPGGLPGTESEAASSAQEDYIRRQNWEMGTMDYMGRDSFSNIWSKICETLDEKVTHDHGSDNESMKNKTDTPSEKTESDVSKLGKGEIDGTPEKMTAEKKGTEEAPTGTGEKEAGAVSEPSSKTGPADPDPSSKASQALEAFGKLFVSGPVVIKSEEPKDISKPSGTDQSEPASDRKEQTGSGEGSDRKKSIESDEEGKKKKGVLSKILELVGVEPSETPKSVFYDTEESAAKSHTVGGSVFYDTDDGQVSPGNLKVAEGVPAPLQPGSSSPSLKLKTTPGTEIVPPTPPSTPLTDVTDKVPAKDQKFLATDDTIMETPPVTDKKLLEGVCDREVVKSEVENIIETAVQCVEEQLNRGSQEGILPAVEKVSSLLPKASEALEAFGKLFVSGPVTIKSEVEEDVLKTPETAEKGKIAETTADETEKDGAGQGIVTEAASKVPPTEAIQDVISTEITPESTPKSTGVGKDALAEKTGQAEILSSKDVDVSLKPAQTPEGVVKLEESVTGAAPLESVPDGQAKDKEKAAELPKPAGETQEDSQKPEKFLVTTETPVALPESVPDTLAKLKEVSSELTPKLEELKSEVSEESAAREKGLIETGTPVTPSESIPKLEELKSKVSEESAAQEKGLTETGTPVTPSGSTPVTSTKPEEEPIKVWADSQGKAQEISQKLDEAVLETSPKASQEGAGATAKAGDTSPKLTPGDRSETVPSTESASGEDSLKKEQEISSVTPKIPSEPAESQKTEPVQSPSLSSKASEALEAFGKVFTSGPVVLKSEVPENPPEPTKPEEEISPPRQEATSSEALEAFGKVFVSGPVTIKSEVEETDAVHPVFQAKPEDEPIYCNIDEVEEIKVTSEEDRKKEKPQSSKLTEQILKAIPPQDRRPFTEASSVSSEVSQLLASIEPQNVSILLDKPMTDEMVTAEGDDSSPVPPVPPRRNRSKGRDAPLPPPKKKGKNEKP